MTKPVVFISYSHQDESWKDRLVKHLKVLQMEDILKIWEDRQIEAGENWYQEIKKTMNESKVAILLVSVDFLTSKFILGEEVPHLLKLRAKEGLKIYPVIIKPCAWENVKWLSEMNLRPKDGRAISGGNSHRIDTDLKAIVQEIASIIQPTGAGKIAPVPVNTPSKLSAYPPQLNNTKSPVEEERAQRETEVQEGGERQKVKQGEERLKKQDTELKKKNGWYYVLLGGGHSCILWLLLSDLFTIFYNWEHNAGVLIFLLIFTLVSIISTIIIYKIFKDHKISEILSYINIGLLLILVVSLVFIGNVIFKPPGWGPFIFFLIFSGPSVANLIVNKIIRGGEKSSHPTH